MDGKSFIIQHLQQINRPGTESLLYYLEERDFYTAPASRSHHHSCEGGLVIHSIEVYQRALELRERNPQLHDYLEPDSVCICALLHDLCKTKLYRLDENGKYTISRRQVTGGHGRLSLAKLDKVGYELTEDERHAIRWHMGRFTSDLTKSEDVIDYKEALTHPLTWLIHTADTLSAKGVNIEDIV